MLRLHLGSEVKQGGFPGEEFPVAWGIAFCSCLRPIFPFIPIRVLIWDLWCHLLQSTMESSCAQGEIGFLFEGKVIMVFLSFNVQQR